MLLSDIFDKAPNIEIKCLSVDSRMPMDEGIFFCIRGFKSDGHKYYKQAIDNGAKVVIYQDDIDTNYPAVFIRVDDVTNVLNRVAKIFYGNPSLNMDIYGVTGTNGKTTITSILKQLIMHFKPCGYIGTIGIIYGDKNLVPSLTTPTILDNNRYLANMYNSDIKACTIEVSSIGIEQKRIDSIDFDVAIYTNLTHDHLDYHGDMDNYFKAKKRFFDNLKNEAIAITNLDDEYGLKIIEDTKAKKITYSLKDDSADYYISDLKLEADTSSFVLKYHDVTYLVNTNLVAEYNIYNLLAAIAAMVETGYDINEVLQLTSKLEPIPGRMHRICEGQNYNVIVDFAHTPDGIEKVFEYAKEITPNDAKIVAVFGSAGRRDVIKRKIFGELADIYCDMIILTEDDPRDESILDIANEIASGIKNKEYVIIESRENAIMCAIDMMNTNDTLLILGKGDETFIYKGDGKVKYQGDDNIAKDYIHKLKEEEENEII